MTKTNEKNAEINFGRESHAELYHLEARNFWFRSRNKLLLWALERFSPRRAQKFLEIGCGTGFVLAAIAERFPDFELHGGEALSEGLAFARARVPSAQLSLLDARALPYESEFDTVGAFDVLEHIAEDEQALTQLHKALRPDGLLFLTVPQHPFLWSPADDYACHMRRYTATELRAKVERAGFKPLKMTSFVSLLLPLMLVSRWTQARKPAAYDPYAELRLTPTTNWLLERLLDAERALIRCGIRFPAGGSLLLIARKC